MSICSRLCEVGCKQGAAADPCTSCCIGLVGIKQGVEAAGGEERPGAGCENHTQRLIDNVISGQVMHFGAAKVQTGAAPLAAMLMGVATAVWGDKYLLPCSGNAFVGLEAGVAPTERPYLGAKDGIWLPCFCFV